MSVDLIANKAFTKSEIKNLVFWFLKAFGSLRTSRLLDKLKYLGFRFNTEAGLSLGLGDFMVPLNITSILKCSELKSNKLKNDLLDGKLDNVEYSSRVSDNWNQTSEIIKSEIIRNFRQKNLVNPLYMMLLSGARGNITQIKQLVGMRGLIVDSQGQIIITPIKNNLKKGLNVFEYFVSCYGARKGVVDTAIKTASSGYLTRKLVYVVQNQFIKKPNCGTSNCQLVLSLKRNKKYYKHTLEAILGRILAKDISNDVIFLLAGQDICNFVAKKVMNFRKFYIRSPLTCKLNEGICQLCYGWNLASGRIVELGENVGVIAAQSISEPGTQLTMRTFHTGGIFSSAVANTIRVEYPGFLFYNNKEGGKIINTKYSEKIFITLKAKKLVLIGSAKKKSVINLPKYTLIYIKNRDRVFSKQIVAEITTWKKLRYSSINKYLLKEKVDIRASISGIVRIYGNFLYVIHGNVISLGLFNKQLASKLINKSFIIDLHKSFELFPIIIKDRKLLYNNIFLLTANFKFLQKFNKNVFMKVFNVFSDYKIETLVKGKLILSKKDGIKSLLLDNFLPSGKFISKNFKLSNKFTNIYSFLVIESYISKIRIVKINKHLFTKNYINKDLNGCLVKKQDKIFSLVYQKQRVKDIVQGLPKVEAILENKSNFTKHSLVRKQQSTYSQIKLEETLKKFQNNYGQKIAVRKSVYKIQKYLVNKIQFVYSEQNVKISDKHIEIVIRQMTSKAIVKKEGGSNFIRGEIVSLNKLEKINVSLQNKIYYVPLIIGISKLAMISDSFLSSSCFQQSIGIFCGAALEGKYDWLHTLKGNLVVGNIIPIMSGYKIKENIKGV